MPRPESGRGFKFGKDEASSETEKGNKESFNTAAGRGCYPRVFGIVVLRCEWGNDLKPVSAILKGDETKRYL